MYGSHWLFVVMPLWAIGVSLYLLMIGLIVWIRAKYEGEPYNNSMSSAHGDIFLIFGVMAAGEAFQRPDNFGWLASPIFHTLLFGMSLLVGVVVQVKASRVRIFQTSKGGFSLMDVLENIWTALRHRENPSDRFHNLVSVPVMVYFGFSIGIPAMFWFGRWYEKVFEWSCFFVWLRLVLFDSQTERLDQPQWLRKNMKKEVLQRMNLSR